MVELAIPEMTTGTAGGALSFFRPASSTALNDAGRSAPADASFAVPSPVFNSRRTVPSTQRRRKLDVPQSQATNRIVEHYRDAGAKTLGISSGGAGRGI